MFGFTVYMIVARFRMRRDWNGPLIYYLIAVIYHQSMPGRIPPPLLYTGVVAALLIRFEFLPKTLVKIIQAVDLGILGFLTYIFLALVAT
jgi:hypothetical protein